MNLKKEIIRVLPLIEEAAQHNNRPLMLSHAEPLLKTLDSEIKVARTPERKRALQATRREIKLFMTQHYYEQEQERLGAVIGLPRDQNPPGVSERTPRKRNEDIALDQSEEASRPESILKGARVVQANTKGKLSEDIRDVKVSTPNFSDELEIGSQDADSTPLTLQKNSENFLLDIGSQFCDSGACEEDDDSEGSAQASESESPSSSQNGPFSLKDFQIQVPESRASSAGSLIETMEELLRAVEAGEEI